MNNDTNCFETNKKPVNYNSTYFTRLSPAGTINYIIAYNNNTTQF